MQILENRKLILLAGCLVLFFPGAFVFGFPGVMASQWQMMFDVNKAQIGKVMFWILIATGCAMVTAGKLQEKIAYHKIIFTGSLACGLGMIFVGQAASIWQVYAWAFWTGFFSGFVYIPCMTVFQKMFPEKKGMVSGVLNLTFGGAAAVMSPVFTWVLIHYGYVVSAGVGAGLVLVFGTAAALLIKAPDTASMNNENTPEVLSVSQIIKLRAFRFLWVTWAIAGGAGVSLIVLASSLGQSLGFDITRYVYILICFYLLNGVGRLLCGLLSDLFSKQKILSVVYALACVAYIIMAVSGSLFWLCTAACLIGLAFGAMFTVSAPLITQEFGIENFGKVFGLVFTAYGFVAGVLGPWLSGVILDVTGLKFFIVFTLFAGYYLLSGILILQVKSG